MAELPPPPEGIVLAHFIVSDDVERSRRFYTEVLGGRVAFSGPETRSPMSRWPTAGSSSTVGGGPTDDKPAVILETPRDPTGSAASSISGSKTSTPCTPNGAPGALSS
jgi:catechol 2,3-dioxygenase-like lactoylglutathione lyase family enzyme